MGVVEHITREPQYAVCFEEKPITLGPMTGSSYRWNPRRLGMMLARYKFVAKMLSGMNEVAEIGCADGFAAAVVAQEVHKLSLFDFDQEFVDISSNFNPRLDVGNHDIVLAPLPCRYDAIYMLDVLEHIQPSSMGFAMKNILMSMRGDGVFIAGMPSIESQAYASPISKAGHVNCMSGDDLRETMRGCFRNVFLFGMNDEVLHTGFSPMCHYLFVLCTGSRINIKG